MHPSQAGSPSYVVSEGGLPILVLQGGKAGDHGTLVGLGEALLRVEDTRRTVLYTGRLQQVETAVQAGHCAVPCASTHLANTADEGTLLAVEAVGPAAGIRSLRCLGARELWVLWAKVAEPGFLLVIGPSISGLLDSHQASLVLNNWRP